MTSLNILFTKWKWHLLVVSLTVLSFLGFVLTMMSKDKAVKKLEYSKKINDILIDKESSMTREIAEQYKIKNKDNVTAIKKIDEKLKELEIERTTRNEPKSISDISNAFRELGY
jgi:hypothetical protein